jgi:hypothetical protein
MEQFERKASFVIAIFLMMAAAGGTLWYLHEQQQTEAQQTVEQTRQVFERLSNDGSTVVEAPEAATTAAGHGQPGDRRVARADRRRSDVSGPLGMSEPSSRSKTMRLSNRLDPRYLLAALLCVAIVAAGLAGASFRLASREREARRDGKRLTLDLDAARARIYAAGLSGQESPDPERVDEQSPELPASIVRAHIPTIVYSPQGDVIALNKAFVDAPGYTRKDIPDVNTWLARGRRLTPERVDAALEAMRRKFEAGESVMPEEAAVWHFPTRSAGASNWNGNGSRRRRSRPVRACHFSRRSDARPPCCNF